MNQICQNMCAYFDTLVLCKYVLIWMESWMTFICNRLTLPGDIVEDGRETASYDCDTGLLAFFDAV